MPRSEDAFVKAFLHKVAGMMLCGSASEVRDSPIVRASKALNIPAEAELFLRQQYKWLYLQTQGDSGGEKSSGEHRNGTTK